MQAEADAANPLSISKRMKHAANFALLAMDTKAMLHAAGPAAAAGFAAAAAPIPAPMCSPAPAAGAAGAAAILSPENEGHANGPLPAVSVSASLPQLLTPLLYRTARRGQDGFTPRGILSPHPGAYDPNAPDSANKKRLSFSVFNGVKLIPSRHQIRALEAERTPSPTKKLDLDTSTSSAESEGDGAGVDEEQRAEERRLRWEQEQLWWDQQMREANLKVEASPTDAAAAPGEQNVPASSAAAAAAAAAPIATLAAANASAPAASPAPRRNSFFSAVSDAILRVLSPRRPANAPSAAAVAPVPVPAPLSLAPAPLPSPRDRTCPTPTVPASAYTSHFTFDRLPSIAAHHGDESACSDAEVSIDSVEADLTADADVSAADESNSSFDDSLMSE